MQRSIRWYDYITMNIFWLGLSTVSDTMTPLIVPLLVQQFVGSAGQGTFLGTLRLWTMMCALLVQALMGMVSDHSGLPWGRRRPFIFLGGVIDLVLIAVIGFSAGLEGMTGYWFLFFMLILLSTASNTAQGAQNGLIPDLVPLPQRGRFSSIKAILEVPLPLILVAFTVGKMVSAGNMWGGILVVLGVVAVCIILTMLVPEKKHIPESKLDWEPFLRLLLMTGLFTVIILGIGYLVNLAGGIFKSISSPLTLAIIMGVIGLTGMAIAVGLGVWTSVRLSIGSEQKKNSSFTWWVVNRLAFLVGANNLAGFTVYFLQGRLGYVHEKAAGPAATLTMFVGIFILFSALVSGWLVDRYGRKRMILISGLVAAFGTLIAIISPSLTLIYVGGCFIGAAIGLFFTANWALGTEIVPKEKAGQYLGIANLAGAGAGAIGAYIGGPLADYMTRLVPSQPGLGYIMLFSIYGTLFLLSIIALLGVHDKIALEKS
jgi:MFS family permease